MKKFYLSVLSLAMLALPVFAEEPSDNSANGLLQAPQEKMQQKAADAGKKGANWIPNISGHVQMGYAGEYNLSYTLADGTTPKDQQTNTFTLNHARVTIKGAPAKWFDYRLQLEFASSVKIMDAEVKFHPLCNKENGQEALNFWLGQSKTPLTLENPYGPTNFEVIDNAQVITNLVGYNQYGFSGSKTATKFGGGRDMGAAVYGSAVKVKWGGQEHNFLEYKLGIYNGAGMNISDVDKYKTAGGFFYLHPVKALTIGASAMVGKYALPAQDSIKTTYVAVATKDGVKSVAQSNTDYYGDHAADYYRYALSFKYDDGQHWMARAEYVYGETEQYGRHFLTTDGWYATLQYTINPNPDKRNQWAVVAKYDGYRPNVNLCGGKISHRIAAGVDYWPTKWMYVQAIYTFTHNQEAASSKYFSGIMEGHKFQATCAVLF